jgi:hypothetical protein
MQIVSRLSDVQFSRFAEMEVAKLLTFGRPRGVLEVMVPMTDDERRDLEAHIKEHFRLSAALQVKASYVLYRLGRAPRLQKSFVVRPERLIEDLFFFYFFGYLDLETMAYRAPVFLVPSHIVHKEAVHELRGGLIHFNFVASMDPSSKDRWRPWACDPSEVAGRMIKFLRAHESRKRASFGRPDGSVIGQPGTILVARAA